MSDHGTEPVERAFFLNVWLKQQGYLSTRFKPMDILPKLGINRTLLGRIATFLKLTKYLNFDAVRKYSNLLPSATGVFGEFGNQAVLSRTNWSKTRAIALAQGPIYINRELMASEEEYLAFRAELVDKLEAMTEPLSGKKVFEKVYLKEEAYQGPYAEYAPDLVALNRDEYHNRAGLSQESVFADSWAWKGNNRRQGMFIAAGPGIRSGFKAEGVRIIDLAPTILHVNDVPVAEDMDGLVLDQLFAADSRLKKPVEYQPPLVFESEKLGSDDFDQMVAERLQKLGYLE
jgi:predicted AlkP superfamily phosphohydrolase/phosphomutase